MAHLKTIGIFILGIFALIGNTELYEWLFPHFWKPEAPYILKLFVDLSFTTGIVAVLIGLFFTYIYIYEKVSQ